MPRINLIRYLAGRSYAHINTLTYLVKTLVLSKIDYGLFLYANSPKTTLNIIKPSYHQAIKSSIYAFITTPINNILAESGLPALEERVHVNKLKLIPKILFHRNSIIDSDTRKAFLGRNIPKVPSAIHNILNVTDKETHHIRKQHIKKYPPWLFDPRTCNTELTKYKKDKTPNTLYLQIFNQKLSQFLTQNYEILYTDASKVEHHTAYAVVDSKGRTLANYTMPSTASIFTAEAAGILDALKIAQKKRKKAVIFTDSLSVLEAIKNIHNNNWNTINIIRDVLYQSRHTQLFWIPGHVGITGNELVDTAAKSACNAPIFNSPIMEETDLLRANLLQYQAQQSATRTHTQHHHYSTINTNNTPAIYPTTIGKEKIVVFSRLRLGHTNVTHSHLLNNQHSSNCQHCTTQLTVKHLLECPVLDRNRSTFLKNHNLINLLKTPTTQNINTIYNYIRAIKVKI